MNQKRVFYLLEVDIIDKTYSLQASSRFCLKVKRSTSSIGELAK